MQTTPARSNTAIINYQRLLNSLPGLYLVLSPALQILEATESYLRSTLTKRKDILGKNFFDAFPENPASHEVQAAKNLQQSFDRVIILRRPDSMPVQRYDIMRPKFMGGGFEERYWLASNSPVFDEDGELIYIVHQAIDVTMQQMAQNHIHTNRERVEVMAQATTDVIWDLDLLTDNIWWSEGLQEIFGYDMHDLPTTESWSACVHPDDYAEVVQGMASVIERGGKIWTDSYRFRRKDGTYANVMERGYIIRDERGIAYRMLGSMFDITEQVSVETKLAESNNRFHFLLDAMPNLAWCAEPGFKAGAGVTYLNKAWHTYTGLPYGTLGGGEQVIHPDDLPAVLEMRENSRANKQPYQQEIRIKNLNTGLYRWFLSRTVPLFDNQGEINLWLGTCTDIHEQKELLNELSETKTQLEYLTNTIPHLVWAARPDGYREYFNQRWTDYTGLTSEESRGYSVWSELLHPEDRERVISRWKQALQTGQFYETEYRFRSANDGSYRWFLAQATPMRNENGAIIRWFGSCTDIENLKRNEIKLQQKTEALRSINHDLDSFIFTASHKLEIPVMEMAGAFEELIRRADFQVSEINKLSERFNNSLNLVNSTINNLSEIVKVQKHLEEARDLINLSEVTEEVKNGLQDLICASHATIITNFETAPAIWFSYLNLKSIVSNLISNSIKYHSPERAPEIILKTSLEGNYTVLTATDNGIGIDLEKHRQKLSPMYRRFHAPDHGTGVGLYIMHRLLSDNGGYAEVESIPDQGTTFKLYFRNKPQDIFFQDWPI